jgi:hypothetical protein
VLRICGVQVLVNKVDEHRFKKSYAQATNQNPIMNAGRTSRGLAQQQTRDIEAIMRPVIDIDHDSRRPQERAINDDDIFYGRTQSQAMDSNDNPFS